MGYVDSVLLPQAHILELRGPTVMVAIFDAKGCYLYASPSHLEMLGYTPGELLGRDLLEVIPKADRAHAMLAKSDSMLFRTSTEIGVRLETKTGELLNMRGRAWHHIDPDTQTEYFIGLTMPAGDPSRPNL